MAQACNAGQHYRGAQDECLRCGEIVCLEQMPTQLARKDGYGGGYCMSTKGHAGPHLNANGPAIEWATRGL